MKFIIVESSYRRTMDHIKSGKPFAIISASRAEDSAGKKMSDKENKRRTKELGKHVRSLGYGFIRAHGRFGELQQDGRIVHARERSMIVPGMSKKHAIEMGKKFGQDSVIHHSGKGAYKFFKTRNTADKGSRSNVGKLDFKLDKVVHGPAQYDTAITKSGWNKPKSKAGKLARHIRAFHLERAKDK